MPAITPTASSPTCRRGRFTPPQFYVSSRFFGESSAGVPPLSIFLTCWKARLCNGMLLMLLIFSLSASTAGGAAIPLWVYGFGVVLTIVTSVATSAMFVSQMAFFNRVSDPKIGGTYMTMLNTISNLGGQWPGTFVLATKGYIEQLAPEANSFYGVTACSVLLGVAWLVIMQRRVLALQALPRKSWLASS